MSVKYSFIGAGNMAGAIIGGMEKAGIRPSDVCLFDTDPSKYGRFDPSYNKASSAAEAAAFADRIVLAVKPQQFIVPLSDIRESGISLDGKTVISIVTGKSMADIQSALGCPRLGVIRTMPNTPLLIGKGVTALTRNGYVGDDVYGEVKELFSSLGSVVETEESRLNDIIADTSSSPAYVFYFIKSMAENAEKHGFDKDVMTKVICDAVIGSAELLKQSDKTADELIRMVCSPGGTTLAAMKVLEEAGTAEVIDRAMDACTSRAWELAKGL